MMNYPLRATRWTPFNVMACAAMCFLAARHSVGHDSQDAVDTMRAVTLLLALGCCAALDDPGAPLLAASPTPLSRRRARQGMLTLLPAAVLWLVAFVITVPGHNASAATTGLALEAVALIAIVGATALVAHRFGMPEPSPVAGSVTVAATLALIGLPHSIRLFTALDDPAWAAVHQRWAVVLAGLALIAASAARDPASRRLHRFTQSRSPDKTDCAYFDDLT